MKVSVLILTFNEAENIGRCLAALDWCDDIVVLDSHSTDRTVEIARSYNAEVLRNSFENFASQRNFGLSNYPFKHDWILHLDADEVVTPEFVDALRALNPNADLDAYRVASKTILYGKWIKHAGMWPTYQVRLGHRERLRFIQVGHGQREDLSGERIGIFPEAYEHYSFSHGMRRWLEKHIRYAKDEAVLLVGYRRQSSSRARREDNETENRRKAKQRSAKIPFFLRPVARFFYVFIVKGGFRDGRRGLIYATMLSVYEGMTAVFAYELIMDEARGHTK